MFVKRALFSLSFRLEFILEAEARCRKFQEPSEQQSRLILGQRGEIVRQLQNVDNAVQIMRVFEIGWKF